MPLAATWWGSIVIPLEIKGWAERMSDGGLRYEVFGSGSEPRITGAALVTRKPQRGRDLIPQNPRYLYPRLDSLG